MLKRIITIWLVALICSSSTCDLLRVVCYGSDGHIAIETIVHKHCECPEGDETGSQYRLVGTVIDSSSDHGHCTDAAVISGVILSVRKNIKTSSCSKDVSAKLTLKTSSLSCPSILSCFSTLRYKLSSFHEPLRTVILLA